MEKKYYILTLIVMCMNVFLYIQFNKTINKIKKLYFYLTVIHKCTTLILETIHFFNILTVLMLNMFVHT